VLSVDNNAVEGALLDTVAPYQRHAACLVVVSNDLHAILVALADRVVKDLTLVVSNLDA